MFVRFKIVETFFFPPTSFFFPLKNITVQFSRILIKKPNEHFPRRWFLPYSSKPRARRGRVTLGKRIRGCFHFPGAKITTKYPEQRPNDRNSRFHRRDPGIDHRVDPFASPPRIRCKNENTPTSPVLGVYNALKRILPFSSSYFRESWFFTPIQCSPGGTGNVPSAGRAIIGASPKNPF